MASAIPHQPSTSGLATFERWLIAAAAVAGAAAIALWSTAVLIDLPEGPGSTSRALALVTELTEYGTESAAVSVTCLIVLLVRRLRA